VAALEKWPKQGIPDKPGAWLMTTARRRAIDIVGQEDRRAADARWLRTLHLIEEAVHRNRDLRQEPPEEVGSATPGTHEEKDAAADREGHPAASAVLMMLAPKNAQSIARNAPASAPARTADQCQRCRART